MKIAVLVVLVEGTLVVEIAVVSVATVVVVFAVEVASPSSP